MNTCLVVLIWILGIFAFISLCLWLAGLYLREKQGSLLYYPNNPLNSQSICSSPDEVGILNFERISIYTLDRQTLKGYLMWPYTTTSSVCSGSVKLTHSLPTKNANMKPGLPAALGVTNPPSSTSPFVLLYFHGNAGNVGHCLGIAKLFLSTLGCAVLMIDYRGFGLSSSAPITQEGLEADAQACLDFIQHDERLASDNLYVMGASLGGAVALHLAAKPRNAPRIAGVIVENTFTSIHDMGVVLTASLIRRIAPRWSNFMLFFITFYVFPLTLHLRWKNIEIISRVSAPILFLSGLKDELVPPEQMRRLYQASCLSKHKGNALRRLVTFNEGSHNDLFLCDEYCPTILSFINDSDKNKALHSV